MGCKRHRLGWVIGGYMLLGGHAIGSVVLGGDTQPRTIAMTLSASVKVTAIRRAFSIAKVIKSFGVITLSQSRCIDVSKVITSDALSLHKKNIGISRIAESEVPSLHKKNIGINRTVNVNALFSVVRDIFVSIIAVPTVLADKFLELYKGLFTVKVSSKGSVQKDASLSTAITGTTEARASRHATKSIQTDSEVLTSHIKAANLALQTVQPVTPLHSKDAGKRLSVKQGIKAKTSKNISATKTTDSSVNVFVSRTVSRLLLILTSVSCVPLIKNVLHYVRTIRATQTINPSNAIEIRKPVSVRVKAKPYLYRHWAMAFIVTTTVIALSTVEYVQRILANAARRVLAPLKRQQLRKEKENQ